MSSLMADIRMYRDFFRGWWKYRRRLARDDDWIQKYAKAKNVQVNPHRMFVTNLKIWIEENRDLYGKQQCPCFEPNGDQTLDRKMICPCTFALPEIEARGTCHCVLFGKSSLTSAEFSAAENELKREYRPRLNLSGNRLDTRGQPKDNLRGLAIPDAMHQVKQALNAVSGDLTVVVDRQASVANLQKLAAAQGFGFSQRELGPQDYEITLGRS